MNSAQFSTVRIILYKMQDHVRKLTESGSLELLLQFTYVDIFPSGWRAASDESSDQILDSSVSATARSWLFSFQHYFLK